MKLTVSELSLHIAEDVNVLRRNLFRSYYYGNIAMNIPADGSQIYHMQLRVLDTLHACLISYAMYWYCIISFTHFRAIQKPIWYICFML